MNKTEFENYLHDHIPVTKSMGFTVEEYSLGRIRIKAPYKENINHRLSVFGGSISSILIMAGWAYVRKLMERIDPDCIIVIHKNTVNYHLPIISSFTAEVKRVNKRQVDTFIEMYEKYGKARISIESEIDGNNHVLADFKGTFVVLKKKLN